jgi:hypothetical protein
MSQVVVKDISSHKRGTTFNGVAWTLSVNGSAKNLTGAKIRMKIHKNTSDGPVEKEFTESSGITITDAAQGKFQLNSQIINLDEGLKYYEIKLTFSDGTVKQYLEGTWVITN